MIAREKLDGRISQRRCVCAWGGAPNIDTLHLYIIDKSERTPMRLRAIQNLSYLEHGGLVPSARGYNALFIIGWL